MKRLILILSLLCATARAENELGFVQSLARNASESAYPNLWRGLIGVWNPQVGIQGQKLFDFARGNIGTLTNGPTWTPGRTGTTITFDGSNDHVLLTRSVVAGLTNVTVMCWIRPTATAASKGIYFEKTNSGGVTRLGLNQITNGTGLIQFGGRVNDGGGFQGKTTTTAPALNVWTHVCGVWDGQTPAVWIYLNGELAATTGTPTAGAIASTTSPTVAIGATLTAGEYFAGNISDLRIYGRILSAPEIMQSYMGASPLVPLK